MTLGQKELISEKNRFDGYPDWQRLQRVVQLKDCFAIIPITTLIAICDKNAVVKVAIALHCQATMEGRKKIIIPYPAWRRALGISKRTYFRAISTLERRQLLRRHRKGPGRKAVLELLGPLAQFPKPPGREAPKTHFSPPAPTGNLKQISVWDHLVGSNVTPHP